jgi:hypothetical protein
VEDMFYERQRAEACLEPTHAGLGRVCAGAREAVCVYYCSTYYFMSLCLLRRLFICVCVLLQDLVHGTREEPGYFNTECACSDNGDPIYGIIY